MQIAKKVFYALVISVIVLYGLEFYRTLSNINSSKRYILANEQKITAYQHEIDSVWDYTHEAIAKTLPDDIDTLLKVRLLTLTQVKYITSYRYFKTMSPDLQAQILATGTRDSSVAHNVRSIMERNAAAQQQIMQQSNRLRKMPFGKMLLKKAIN